MKTSLHIYFRVVTMILTFLLLSCRKDNIVEPVLTISPVINISYNTAISGGTISNGGGAPLISSGVCWSTTETPTVKNSVTTDGAIVGSYISNISGLNPGTKYFIRAYATNSLGTGYSTQLTFTTLAQMLPVVSTNTTTSVTSATAISGGNVTNDGGAAVISKGVCWNTAENPTTANSKTINGSGLGTFTSNITGLSMGTAYYVKAYATNSVGTSYGNQETFVTPGPPILTTTAASSITFSGASSGGTISNDGGSPVTSRGVCWSISVNPTISLSTKTNNGTGTGTYTSSITGLSAGTTYYVRAYATNILGTSYGNQISFGTPGPPSITTTLISSLSINSVTSGGTVTSDGGSAVTVRGVCWGTSTNPTTANNVLLNGSGTGSFTSNLTGLTGDTRYYLRAYAVNSSGTGYGNKIVFKTFTGSVSDIDGNKYNTITIGAQVWIVENLKTTKYKNGDPISGITDNTIWTASKTGAYCFYDNDINNKDIYGSLYNYYALSDSRGICPAGWHVPATPEWAALEVSIGGTVGTSIKLKETGTTHWLGPNTDATNETGFTGLPGGFRISSYGGKTSEGYWWSSTAADVNSANVKWIISRDNTFGSQSDAKYYGHSVRCIHD